MENGENDSQKKERIEEIQRRIEHLSYTDQISDAEKVAIARKVLNIIENGEKEEVVR